MFTDLVLLRTYGLHCSLRLHITAFHGSLHVHMYARLPFTYMHAFLLFKQSLEV